jgi:hypothetical protein
MNDHQLIREFEFADAPYRGRVAKSKCPCCDEDTNALFIAALARDRWVFICSVEDDAVEVCHEWTRPVGDDAPVLDRLIACWGMEWRHLDSTVAEQQRRMVEELPESLLRMVARLEPAELASLRTLCGRDVDAMALGLRLYRDYTERAHETFGASIVFP